MNPDNSPVGFADDSMVLVLVSTPYDRVSVVVLNSDLVRIDELCKRSV